MPRISQVTTEVPNSTSDLLGNIGSTTRRFNVSQLPGTITTAGTSGQVLQTTAGAATWVNSTTILGALPSTVGTSGQVLQTTGGVAAWRGITSGRLLYGNSSGEITELAAGTSYQLLTISSGGTAPSWFTPPSMRAELGANATISSGLQVLNWTVEITDNTGMLSTATNSSRVTFNVPGTYMVSAGAGRGETVTQSLAILHNGSTAIARIGSLATIRLTLNTIYPMAAGDYVTVQLSGDIASTVTSTASFVSAAWLSP